MRERTSLDIGISVTSSGTLITVELEDLDMDVSKLNGHQASQVASLRLLLHHHWTVYLT